MTTVEHRLYKCARCGKRQPGISMIRSSFSGFRYCASFTACDRRVARNKKRDAA